MMSGFEEAAAWSAEEEQRLIARAKRDPQAFAPLYTRYFDSIYRYTYRRFGDRERAADATSQTFLKALTNLESFKSGSFQSWLYTIARNVVIDAVRRTRPQAHLPDLREMVDTNPTPEEHALQNDARRELTELLRELTPDQRSVVELRLAGLTSQEIADRLGRSIGATKTLQWRAFHRLRELMREPDPVVSANVDRSRDLVKEHFGGD